MRSLYSGDNKAGRRREWIEEDDEKEAERSREKETDAALVETQGIAWSDSEHGKEQLRHRNASANPCPKTESGDSMRGKAMRASKTNTHDG